MQTQRVVQHFLLHTSHPNQLSILELDMENLRTSTYTPASSESIEISPLSSDITSEATTISNTMNKSEGHPISVPVTQTKDIEEEEKRMLFNKNPAEESMIQTSVASSYPYPIEEDKPVKKVEKNSRFGRLFGRKEKGKIAEKRDEEK